MPTWPLSRLPFGNFPYLDDPAIRNANRCDSLESIRAANKKTIFITFERFARIASNLCDSQVLVLQTQFTNIGVQARNPDMIRANRLRMDSREYGGHLSFCISWNRVLGRGCDEAEISEEKHIFHWIGGRHSVNGGFGKEFYRKGYSMKGSGPFRESPDSANRNLLLCSSPSWEVLDGVDVDGVGGIFLFFVFLFSSLFRFLFLLFFVFLRSFSLFFTVFSFFFAFFFLFFFAFLMFS